MVSRQSRWRHDNQQVRVNIDATLVAIFRIALLYFAVDSANDQQLSQASDGIRVFTNTWATSQIIGK